MSDFLVIDLETENNPYFGAIASPRHPDNYVVAEAHCIGNGPVVSQYFESKSPWLSIPDNVTMLVAHNAPFEVDWMLVNHPDEFMRFLSRGGRVFCTAYAEYLLTNQQETYPALDVVAPKYGGTPKVDGIKILWEQGVKTSQIDRTLLLDYLAGPNGDVENTRRCFLGQWALLQERGMLNMAFARMEGMLYNCFAMHAGLHVDREVAFLQRGKIEDRLTELNAKFAEFRKHIPDYVSFKGSSDYHMSAWLFGGPIKYRIKDTWFEEDGITPKYEKADCFMFGETLVQCAHVDTPETFESAVRQYGAVARSTSGKNKGQPKVVRANTGEFKQKYYDRLFQCPALVQIDALPTDLSKAFRADFAGKRKLSDESPVYSTGSECIEMLSKRPEFSEEVREVLVSLLEYAKLDKDAGTYYLREVLDEEGNVIKMSGMLQYLNESDIVHHMLNCTATVTTRLSGTRPNMQNIPRGDTSDVKRVFSSRYDNPVWLGNALAKGYITPETHADCLARIASGAKAGQICEADYSALEVVTLAAFSRDKNLVRALLDNIDMHCMRLSQQLKEPYEDVLRKCKDEDHPDHKKYKTMRTNIKPKAFAYQYGATAHGIAFATGCTVEEAQEFIDAEKALFPDVEAYYEDVIFKTVETHTSIHREQSDNGNWRVFKRGTWQSPGGTCYEFRQYPKTNWVNGQRIEAMEFKPTQMRNYPIQGESGFFVQVIAGLVMRWLVSKNFYDGRVCIINQVHDALYLDVHHSIVNEVGIVIKHIMESLPIVMQAYGYDLGVPFPAEVEFGDNMLKKSKFIPQGQPAHTAH